MPASSKVFTNGWIQNRFQGGGSAGFKTCTEPDGDRPKIIFDFAKKVFGRPFGPYHLGVKSLTFLNTITKYKYRIEIGR